MKESQKKVIEINHALSGIHGEEMKSAAFKINEMRKEILKKIDRKKKLSSIIHDELYSYLQKFPEEKTGLHQELKKKKLKLSEYEEKYAYQNATFQTPNQSFLCNTQQELTQILHLFKFAPTQHNYPNP